MENRQPISRARVSSRVGGSRRSGRELISTAVPVSRQAVKTFSASNFAFSLANAGELNHWLVLRTSRTPLVPSPVRSVLVW